MNPREKRAPNNDHAKHTEGKKPRSISSEVLAALQMELLCGPATNFETMIRSVVAEEIDRAFSRVDSQGRVISPARKFHLRFRTNPAAKNFTESNLRDEHDNTICVMLIDANTGQHITTGPESVATLEVVPLMGDFNTSEEQDWDAEEFEKHVEKGREGKGQLLVGELKVHLKGGLGTLGQIHFTDNSSVTRSKKFRLGVREAQDNDCGHMSIREGKSKAFTVIDNRGKAYRKHDTPSPTDDVWRLRNIGKEGPYHTKLRQKGIHTVKDFLSCLETRPECLKKVLGKMSEKAYQDTIDHARKCVLGDMIYIYPVVEQPPYETLIFDPLCRVLGAVRQGQYVGLEMIDGIEKVRVDALVKSAYDHWDTDVTVQDLATAKELSMIAAPGAVDGSAEDAAPQEAIDGSPRIEPITGQGYVDGNVVAEWTSQEHRSVLGIGNSSQNWSIHPLDEDIASCVDNIMSEEYGELFSLDDPSPGVGKWWLRIRTVVRCALFIRRAGSARQQQPSMETPSLT